MSRRRTLSAPASRAGETAALRVDPTRTYPTAPIASADLSGRGHAKRIHGRPPTVVDATCLSAMAQAHATGRTMIGSRAFARAAERAPGAHAAKPSDTESDRRIAAAGPR